MGYAERYRCTTCGNHFTVARGPNMFSHVLHCDRCGLGRGVRFAELGDIHERWIAGLGSPWSIATMQHDRHLQETFEGEPLTDEEYEAAVDEWAGSCECGGRWRLKAPAQVRCPTCRGVEAIRTETLLTD
jgi:hypothetical protein